MMKGRLLISFILLCLFVVPGSASQAAGGKSARFFGYVTLNGASVPLCTPISAWIGHQKVAESPSFMYADKSLFVLRVPEDDLSTAEKEGGVEGEIITFRVANSPADQTAAWHSGPSQEVSLSAVTPPPRPVKVRFGGLISQIAPVPEGSAEIWTVANVVVVISSDTVISPEGYRASVGDRVQVKATRQANGLLVAEQVIVYVGAIGAVPIQFRGVIESIVAVGDALSLTIEGTTVIVDQNTVLEGILAIGYVADVKGDLEDDGTVLARRILSISPEAIADIVEFEGEIEEMHKDWWLIAGVQVWIADVELPPNARVGLIAEVKGRRREDGSVEAISIAVEELVPSEEVRFAGVIKSISDDTWVIETTAATHSVYLDRNTFVDESRAPVLVGNWAYVLAVQRPDRSLLALRIRLERPPG